MNENIDLTIILKGCPKGTRFYSSNCGEISFNSFRPDKEYPLLFDCCDDSYVKYTKEGFYLTMFKDAECTVFPSKEHRDWSKFVRFWDKPKKEKFDPNTLQPFDKVLVRADDGHTWRCGFVSHIVSADFDKELVCTSDGLSVRCVPYNDETKHLVGTTDDCPDYYKWWQIENDYEI